MFHVKQYPRSREVMRINQDRGLNIESGDNAPMSLSLSDSPQDVEGAQRFTARR